MCFDSSNDVDTALSNWIHLFLSAVNEHIPKCRARNVNDPPWIDNELRSLLRKKDLRRKKLRKKCLLSVETKYKELRRSAKSMLAKKKKDYAVKLNMSISENPKRFWSYVKSCTSTSDTPSPNFLRDGHVFLIDSQDKANILNKFFHSVFSPDSAAPTPSYLSLSSDEQQLEYIGLTVSEVMDALMSLIPIKLVNRITSPNLC